MHGDRCLDGPMGGPNRAARCGVTLTSPGKYAYMSFDDDLLPCL